VIVVFLRRTRINPQSGFERLCRVMLDVVLDAAHAAAGRNAVSVRCYRRISV
jgi:hypothetical protein